jgi:hypothetical protein
MFKQILYICFNINKKPMEEENLNELSAEELAARKEQMKQYFEESVPYLEAQLKHETLLTSIDEQRFKRAQIGVQYAMMMQNLKEDEEHNHAQGDPVTEGSVNPQTKERKLKKN